MEHHIIIFCTTKDKEESLKIYESLFHKKLIACVNELESINSSFIWNGKINHQKENLLIMKSKLSLFKEIKMGIRELHSYEVPEIIAIPIIAGDEDYLEWLDASLEYSK